jgi:hypothetical protein
MHAMRFLSRGWWIFGALVSPLAADFVPPAEGPVPFRRDRLPVDPDTMTALSRQLTLLTGARVADDPDELRAVAQMAALALALDPANREARELVGKMQDGGAPEPADGEELERARNRAWQTLAWLEMPEAGDDGQALAACLGDVLAVADPRHPKAAARRSAGEQGKWQDWVADASAFTRREPAPADTDEDSGDAMEEPAEEPEDEKKPVTLALKEARLTMPLWVRNAEAKASEPYLAAVPVSASGSISEEGGLLIQVGGEEMAKRFSQPFRQVEAAMKQRHGSLPNGLRISIDSGKGAYSLTRNGLGLTGTTALLMDGMLTGKLPQAHTLAVVGEGGKLELPLGFWRTLRGMSALPEGMRIVLPDEAADYLTALVVLDDAAFFMKHEVLLAGSVDELCDLASATPEPEVAEGLKRFGEIRKVGEGKALGSFVAHPSTQQRLRDLSELMPEHASARMLALQGSGSRPRFLQRKVLAHEIRAAIEPAGMLVDVRADQLEPKTLDRAHETCRASLDEVAGYIDIRDRDLHKSAVDVADNLRTLGRLLGKGSGSGDDQGTVRQKQTEAYQSARRAYVRVMRELTLAAGDIKEYPLPKTGEENEE